jgi:uncharacterized protein (DUF983 family)
MKWKSIFRAKCPVCLQGEVYESKSVYNIKKFDKMHERCNHCNHKYEIETGFWYGAMYVSYGLTVAISVATFVLTFLIYPEASSFLYIGLIFVVVLIFAPITYRTSRLVWMNFFSKYDESKSLKNE